MLIQRHMLCTALGLAVAAASGAASAETTLRASHQFPGGQGDLRDEMVRMIAHEVEVADVGLKIQVFPDASLYKAAEQWDALKRGQLDMAIFPLDYASAQVPQFSVTLMPGLVRNYDHAQRLNASGFMKDIKDLAEKNGLVVIADAWLAGGFASKKHCITSPDTIKGQVVRAAGPAFEQMLAAAGASISSMPSDEVYSALQAGTLDAANTSNNSFMSYHLYEQVVCLTAPGENALWFMYEPVVMSKQVFDRLELKQREAITTAARRAEDSFITAAKSGEQQMRDIYTNAGVEVVTMSSEDYQAWMSIAKHSSYRQFATKVPDGDILLKKALAVQ